MAEQKSGGQLIAGIVLGLLVAAALAAALGLRFPTADEPAPPAEASSAGSDGEPDKVQLPRRFERGPPLGGRPLQHNLNLPRRPDAGS